MMATRIGIELSPDACRIAEIDLAPAWARRGAETRVRSFAILPPSGPETEAKLRSLRNRRAAVVVWNAASDHRQVMVSPGSYESMRAEAIGALDAAGVETRGVFVDIAPATRTADRTARRRLVVALASGTELTAALQPLLAAGIRVRTVMTPAAALSSLARLRRESWTPNALEVFVALEERVTCIALMRSGALIASRDLGWGYVDEFGSGLELRRREDIATRLVNAISDFVAATGGAPGDIKHICVCGGHPELRSVTAPLMEQLEVEFEPLDSLFGIDAARLPEPVDEFRERSAELRLAWAAAADSPATINLLRALLNCRYFLSNLRVESLYIKLNNCKLSFLLYCKRKYVPARERMMLPVVCALTFNRSWIFLRNGPEHDVSAVSRVRWEVFRSL